jgi:hypothetical protein
MWYQVVDNTLRRACRTSDGTWIHKHGGGLYDDGNGFPYGMDDLTTHVCSDSPGISLKSNYTQMTCDVSYTMYLMYKPSGTAIEVPLRKVSWSWAGDASRSGTNWHLNSSTDPSASESDCTIHPEWPDKVSTLQYHDE